MDLLYTGRVDAKGVLVLDRPFDFARLKNALREKRVEVILRKAREKRSLDQNAYLHQVLPILCDYTGNSTARMKLVLLGEKWGYERDPITGREFPIKPHTSELSVAEFSELIEWLPMWAMQKTGCTIPLPNEVVL